MKKGCFEFGRELILEGDLDPVYALVHFCPELVEDRNALERWLLAYWCFYHVGTASWIVSGDYWDRMRTAAGSKTYPRSSERRYFRGLNAEKSVGYLESRGLASLFGSLRGPLTCRQAMKEVQTWVGFGPWIAFKVADMLERLGVAPVVFEWSDVYLFDSPRKGAENLRESLGANPEHLTSWAVETITDNLKDLYAPPSNDRPIGVQEAETVLCKWHSYLKGSYHIGEDITACRRALLKFPKVKLCQNLLRAGRKASLW